MLEKGVNIDTSMFDLKFLPPQNFAAYRQSEVDNARVPTYQQMAQIPHISNRYAMKRFLGMSMEEIAENERMWKEENAENITPPPGDAAAEMRSVGINSAGISADIAGAEDIATEGEQPEVGADDAGPETATGDTPAAGATPPATDQTI